MEKGQALFWLWPCSGYGDMNLEFQNQTIELICENAINGKKIQSWSEISFVFFFFFAFLSERPTNHQQ